MCSGANGRYIGSGRFQLRRRNTEVLKKINVPSTAELRSKMEEYLLEHATDAGAEDERTTCLLSTSPRTSRRM